jgi:hypothetical protein
VAIIDRVATHQGWPLRCIPFAIYFFIVACDDPTNDDLTVINYTAPALEGSIIAIECDSPIASANNYYTSTCVEGRWEPSLGQLSARCRGMLCMGHSYIQLE